MVGVSIDMLGRTGLSSDTCLADDSDASETVVISSDSGSAWTANVLDADVTWAGVEEGLGLGPGGY